MRHAEPTATPGYASRVRKRPVFQASVAVIAVLALLVASCSKTERPSVEGWQPVWERMVQGFPTADELGDPPDHAVCSRELGSLRSASEEIHPTPDLAIDDVVDDWVTIAEDMLYECPPASQAIPSLAYGYGELARLEAEVATVLDIDTTDG